MIGGGGQGVGAPPPSNKVRVWASASVTGTLIVITEQIPSNIRVAVAILNFMKVSPFDYREFASLSVLDRDIFAHATPPTALYIAAES